MKINKIILKILKARYRNQEEKQKKQKTMKRALAPNWRFVAHTHCLGMGASLRLF
jgi:hypothetical protein